MQILSKTFSDYSSEIKPLDSQSISAESTFYPNTNILLSAISKKIQIPFRIRVNTAKSPGMLNYLANVPEAAWIYRSGNYCVRKKWLGYFQTDRRDGRALTGNERNLFRQIARQIIALIALGPQPDALYQLAASDVFMAAELGVER